MRKTTNMLAALAALALAFAIRPAKAGGNGTAAFEQLKSLAGHWETEKSNRERATLDLELTSGGTAVIERAHVTEEGKQVEMITLYYLDGEQLKMTHYCMAGNQPRMQARGFNAETGELEFQFLDATNLANSGAGHMHSAKFRFVDNDHLATQWEFYENGQPKMTETAQYTRVR